MSRFGLSRRSFLKGLGGVAVALPALEAMSRFGGRGGARAADPLVPKRFVLSYAGISTGTYSGSGHADRTVPLTVGPGYEATRGLQPLFDLGVNGDVSIVSGLLIPHGPAGDLPPGGRVAEFHYGPTITPQLCGMAATARSEPPRGPTADQLVADVIAGDTPHRVLSYRVQAASYDGSNSTGGNPGRLSWRRTSDGSILAVDPFSSPRLAYESLFTGFAPQDPAEALQAAALLRRRKSALDLVSESTQALLPRLGAADRQRLEQHFEEIRALETRLDAVDPTRGSCQLLTHPGEDPPIGGAIKGDGNPYSTSAGYSEEEIRAQVMTDLLHMAFVCDLTRSASFQLTYWKCYMNMFPLTGAQTDMHELTHGAGSLDDLSDAVAWHVKHFGRLVEKLKGTQEIDGTSLLDHSALALVWEGGHGYDPEGDNDNSPHSSENMIVLVAGRAGGLRGGLHISAPSRHPAEAVISAMNAVGHTGGMGEISTRIDELLG
jgi:hypothetical protein